MELGLSSSRGDRSGWDEGCPRAGVVFRRLGLLGVRSAGCVLRSLEGSWASGAGRSGLSLAGRPLTPPPSGFVASLWKPGGPG